MKTKKVITETTNVSRRDALKKAGKYAIFTAAASMIFLAPKSTQAASTTPGWEV